MEPVMVTIPVWLLALIVVGVAAVSGGVFWTVGRFLFRKGDDSTPEEEEAPPSTPLRSPTVPDPASQAQYTSQKEKDTMATPAEIKKDLERAAQNLTRITTALRNERSGRAEDKRKSDEVIAARDQEIADLKEHIEKLAGEKEAQGSAVAQGAASLSDANKDAEAALADS